MKRFLLSTFYFIIFTLSFFAQDRPKIGLVLGGGGAKGAAQIGALKVIEQAGIPVDYVAGTSIGAIVGGLWASGYSAQQLDSMFRSQQWLTLLLDHNQLHQNKLYEEVDGMAYVFGFPIMRTDGKKNKGIPSDWSKIGAIKGDSITALLQSMTRGHSQRIPFRCVAVDIYTMKEVLLPTQQMPLAQSMRASMAIPGVFKPVKDKAGHVLVDGGMMNNLPVDIVRGMGADIVIAIDLTQNKHAPSDFSLKDLTGVGGIIDWVLSRPDRSKYADNCKSADIYINPNLGTYDSASFSRSAINELIRLGETEAKKHLARLRHLANP